MKTLQEHVDNFNADFSSQSCQEMELKDQMTDLEKESTRQRELLGKVKTGSDKHKQQSKAGTDVTRKINRVKNELAALQLKKAKTEEKLEEAQGELKAKQGQYGSRKVTFADDDKK